MIFNHTITVGSEGTNAYASLNEKGEIDEINPDDMSPEDILAMMEEVIRIKNLLYKKPKAPAKKK